MPKPPGEEIPSETMPETDQSHGAELAKEDDQPHREIADTQEAREWIEIIRTKPLSQSDVPAIPKSGEIGLEIRAVEILGQEDAEKHAEANSDLGVTGEIKE